MRRGSTPVSGALSAAAEPNPSPLPPGPAANGQRQARSGTGVRVVRTAIARIHHACLVIPSFITRAVGARPGREEAPNCWIH